MSESQAEGIREGIYRCLERLRPNAVSLVDSWDFDDAELHSVRCSLYKCCSHADELLSAGPRTTRRKRLPSAAGMGRKESAEPNRGDGLLLL